MFRKHSKSDPLLIGSVKSNLGHLEAAAGATGLLKLALSLQNGNIPASLHASEPSPLIDWDDMPISVSGQPCEWQARNGRRIGGVSSFGFSGTNAHIVLGDVEPATTDDSKTSEVPMILALSAAGESAAIRACGH